MKKAIIFLSFAFFSTLVLSCKKDASAVITKSVEDLLIEQVSRIQNTKGGIIIAARENYSKSSGKMKVNYQIEGSFDNEPFDSVSVQGIALEPIQKLYPNTPSNQYIITKDYGLENIKNLFGRKLTIGYHKRGLTASSRTEDVTIQTPSQLDLNVPGLNNTSSSYRNIPITWIAGNSGSVYVLISFQPESVSNAAFRTYSRIDRFISVPDNGSYTISNDKFLGIPEGAKLIIAVARGNTALAAGMATGTDRTSITAIATAMLVGVIGGGGGGCGSDICIEPN